jgi:hypothetical protein
VKSFLVIHGLNERAITCVSEAYEEQISNKQV